MQIGIDILQIVPLGAEGSSSSSKLDGRAAGSKHMGAKLLVSFFTKCPEHLLSSVCHKTSCWE